MNESPFGFHGVLFWRSASRKAQFRFLQVCRCCSRGCDSYRRHRTDGRCGRRRAWATNGVLAGSRHSRCSLKRRRRSKVRSQSGAGGAVTSFQETRETPMESGTSRRNPAIWFSCGWVPGKAVGIPTPISRRTASAGIIPKNPSAKQETTMKEGQWHPAGLGGFTPSPHRAATLSCTASLSIETKGRAPISFSRPSAFSHRRSFARGLRD